MSGWDEVETDEANLVTFAFCRRTGAGHLLHGTSELSTGHRRADRADRAQWAAGGVPAPGEHPDRQPDQLPGHDHVPPHLPAVPELVLG